MPGEPTLIDANILVYALLRESEHYAACAAPCPAHSATWAATRCAVPAFITTVGASLTTVAAGVDPTQNSFSALTGTRDARVLQFALKLYF